MSLYSDLNEVLTPYAQRIKGLAAIDNEIKADLGDISKDVRHVISINGSSISYLFSIKTGETYVVTNNGEANVSIRLRQEMYGENLQAVIVNAGRTVEFTAEVDANYVNPYPSANIDVVIKLKGTCDQRIAEIEAQTPDFVKSPVKTDDISGYVSEDEYQIPSGLNANHTRYLNLSDVGVNLKLGPVEVLLSGGDNDTSGFTYANVITYDKNLNSVTTRLNKNEPKIIGQTFGDSRPYIRFYYADLDKDQDELTVGGSYKITYSNLPAIITEKVMPLAITSDKIADNAVTIGKISDMIPDYWRNHITSKCTAIVNRMAEIGKNGETFVFITDIHWYQNEKKSPHLIRYILNHTNVNMVICGGDLITQGTKQYEIDEALKCVKAYDYGHIFMPIAFGNHDNNSNQSILEGRIFDINTVYSLFMKPFENNVTFLTDTEFSFYFDKEVNKTRYIVLDTGDDGASKRFTAFNELYETLMSVPAGYKVLVIAHIIDYGYFTAYISEMIDAFNSRLTVTVNGETYNFSSANGEVILCVGGHRHIDKELSTSDGVFITVSDCDAMRSNNEETPQVRRTITEQSFEVVSIDYNRKIAYYEKIGRGRSRIFHLEKISTGDTLTPTIDGNITWGSSDTDIATVSNGVVTRVSDGRAIIKADSDLLMSEIWVI